MAYAVTEAPAKAKDEKRRRLTEADWAEAGLKALADHGLEGVRIDSLASQLGVTKGSFYWHFKNRDELLDAIARFWGDTEPDTLIEEVCSLPGDPKMRLDLLGVVYLRKNMNMHDRAMRAWALTDARADAAVIKASRRVQELMLKLYGELGFDEAEARLRTRVHILCSIGRLFAAEYRDFYMSDEDTLAEERARFLNLMTQGSTGESGSNGRGD